MYVPLLRVNQCVAGEVVYCIDVDKATTGLRLTLDGRPCRVTPDGYQCGTVALPRGLLHTISYLPGPTRGVLKLFAPNAVYGEDELEEETIPLPATPADWARQRDPQKLARDCLGWDDDETHNEEWLLSGVWVDYARVAADWTYLDRASQAIEKMEDPVLRTKRYTELAWQLCVEDHVEATTPSMRSLLLRAEAGYLDLVENGRPEAEWVVPPLAGAMAAAGNVDRALAMVERVKNATPRWTGLAQVIPFLSDPSHFGRAIRVARTLSRKEGGLLGQQFFEQLLKELPLLLKLYLLAEVLHWSAECDLPLVGVIADRLMAVGAVTPAKRLLAGDPSCRNKPQDPADDKRDLAEARYKKGLSLVEARQFGRALALARGLTDRNQRFHILARIVEMAPSPQHYWDALTQIVRQYPKLYEAQFPEGSLWHFSDETVEAVARALARGGWFAQALEVDDSCLTQTYAARTIGASISTPLPPVRRTKGPRRPRIMVE